jgi:hypothetical protein
MRRLSCILAVLFLSGVAGGGWASADTAAARTSKSLDAFTDCFVQAQERASQAWWFVPTLDGGTFSNLGAKGAQGTYFVQVRDLGAVRTVDLETSDPRLSAAIGSIIGTCI